LLTRFSLNFVPLKAIKGEIVVKFFADHTHVEILECFVGIIKPWLLYFDGSKHIDCYGIGVVIIFPNNKPLKTLFEIRPTF